MAAATGKSQARVKIARRRRNEIFDPPKLVFVRAAGYAGNHPIESQVAVPITETLSRRHNLLWRTAFPEHLSAVRFIGALENLWMTVPPQVGNSRLYASCTTFYSYVLPCILSFITWLRSNILPLLHFELTPRHTTTSDCSC